MNAAALFAQMLISLLSFATGIPKRFFVISQSTITSSLWVCTTTNGLVIDIAISKELFTDMHTCHLIVHRHQMGDGETLVSEGRISPLKCASVLRATINSQKFFPEGILTYLKDNPMVDDE